MRYTIDRIASLLTHCGLPPLPNIDWTEIRYQHPNRPKLHEVLDTIDTTMNVDTTFNLDTIDTYELGGPLCRCTQSLGTCSHRRQLGARVALLEERMARDLSG